MPAFSFEALNADGRITQGVMEADSARAARGLLRAQDRIPLAVHPVNDGRGKARTGIHRELWRTRTFSATGLTIWTRQVAGLVGAGLPLERALSALAEEAEGERQRGLLAALRAEVNSGASFAGALSHYPREFSGVYIAVVGAGEQSGKLGLVLERLADDLEDRLALKSKLIGAALYPAIVSVVALVIVLFLMGYVIPQVANVFAGSKRALPWLTVAMLALSGAVRNFGLAGLLVLVGLTVSTAYALRLPSVRMGFDAAWLNVPIIGKLARGYNTTRFASTLAMLAGAGVPILKALRAAAQTLNNRAMRADALDALVMVREGVPLASALASKKRFPGLLSMFARLGEQTGTLAVMLQRAAVQLSADVQRRALLLATVLEPLLIVAMGVVVMLIVLAVLLPIIQLNQLVR